MYAIFDTNNADLIEVIQEFENKIYLGNWEAARNIKYLNTNNIRFVLSAIPAYIASFNEFKKEEIVQKVIDSNDIPHFDMYSRLHEAADFIHESVKVGSVLVHCAAGISRSTTCLIAYYIKYRSMTFEEALAFIRKNRPIACPNTGFQKQLKRFENELRQ